MAASSRSSLSSVCMHFLKVLSCICLKLPSYLFYGEPLSFSIARLGEQQFCLHLTYHLHDFVNLDHILPQVSPLQIDKSQPFALPWQGRWLILGFFFVALLSPFLCKLLCVLEMGRPEMSQPSSCGCTRALYGGKMTPSALF